jgi:hypothetical protein
MVDRRGCDQETGIPNGMQGRCVLAAREESFGIPCGLFADWLELVPRTGAAGWRLGHGARPESPLDHFLRRDALEPIGVWRQQFQ